MGPGIPVGGPLPPGLALWSRPLLLAATGLMLVVELFADTIPGIDSIWDVIHTVIRVPAGSALAASVLGGRDAVVPGRRAVPIASMH